MKLLFVSPYYPPYAVGGAEESTFALARALRTRGHDVRVLSLRLGDEPPAGRVPVEVVDAGVELRNAGEALPAAFFDRPAVQWRLAGAIARAARTVDLVHSQTLHLLPAAFFGARRSRVPVVATIRDLAGICPIAVSLLEGPRVPPDCGVIRLERRCIPEFRSLYGGRSRPRMAVTTLLRFWAARGRSQLLRRCDAIYAVGSDIGPLYADAGLVPESRVQILPNIVEFNGRADPSAHADHVVYAGRISHGKGVGVLLDAFALARESEPELRLVVAGRADRRWQARLEAAEGVEYRGWLPRAELPKLYREARVAVVPSIWPEPLGRAALEASACGLPVVAAASGGLRDAVVDEETGLVVPPRDSRALADAILRLWRDPPWAASLGAAGRARVERLFSADTISRHAEHLYESVLGSR